MYIYNYLFILHERQRHKYRGRNREMEKERFSTHWFTQQMAITAGLGQDKTRVNMGVGDKHLFSSH